MTGDYDNARDTSEILDRVPPHNLEAEMAVLGSVILDPSKLDPVDSIVRPDHFHADAHRRLYTHLRAVRNGDGAIDTTILCQRLKEGGDLEACGGLAYLAEIVHSVAAPAHAEHYAKIVRDHAIRRSLIDSASEILTQAYSGQGSAQELAEHARTLFGEHADEAAKTLFPAVTCADLVRETYDEHFYVDRLFIELQPLVIGGPMKAMKTSILCALVYSLATARPFLGRFPVPRAARVGLLSGESGRAAIRSLFIRIGTAVGFDATDVVNLVFDDNIPQITDPDHEAGIRRLILDHELEILAVDPLYLGNDDDSQSNLSRQGKHLRRFSKLCLDLGVTPIICHHTRKFTTKQYEPLDLSDLHGAGIGEFARQWFLINRRSEYKQDGRHELWLVAGGSYGHGARHAIEIAEGVWDGPGSRYWQVRVMGEPEARLTAHEAQQAAKDVEKDSRRRIRIKTDMESIRQALADHPAGETCRVIREAANLSGTRFQTAFSELEENGEVVPCSVSKQCRKKPYKGYKLAES